MPLQRYYVQVTDKYAARRMAHNVSVSTYRCPSSFLRPFPMKQSKSGELKVPWIFVFTRIEEMFIRKRYECDCYSRATCFTGTLPPPLDRESTPTKDVPTPDSRLQGVQRIPLQRTWKLMRISILEPPAGPFPALSACPVVRAA